MRNTISLIALVASFLATIFYFSLEKLKEENYDLKATQKELLQQNTDLANDKIKLWQANQLLEKQLQIEIEKNKELEATLTSKDDTLAVYRVNRSVLEDSIKRIHLSLNKVSIQKDSALMLLADKTADNIAIGRKLEQMYLEQNRQDVQVKFSMGRNIVPIWILILALLGYLWSKRKRNWYV